MSLIDWGPYRPWAGRMRIRTPCVTACYLQPYDNYECRNWLLLLLFLFLRCSYMLPPSRSYSFHSIEASYLVVYLCRLTVNNPVLIAWVHTSCMTQHSFPFPQSSCATKLAILFWRNMQKGQYSQRGMEGSKGVVVVRAVKTIILQNKKANVSLLQMNNMAEHCCCRDKNKTVKSC